jgi:hypothetical protein
MTTTTLDPAPRAVYPIPANRGRWRLTVHRRQFSSSPTWDQTIVAELVTARGRRLDQTWNGGAVLTFTVDGADAATRLVLELQTDVYAWRFDEVTGTDVCVFRGIVTQSEDQISEQSHAVTFTAHDYGAMLARRISTAPVTFTQTDQDTIAAAIVAWGGSSSAGTSFAPGSFLPLQLALVGPDGSPRTFSNVLRDRNYPASSIAGDALDQLAKVDGGFDYDVVPGARSSSPVDRLRIFWPAQGITRTDAGLVYGSTVAALTRSVTSADYANYLRVLGNNGSSDPNAAQRYAEASNADANNVTVSPVGLWQTGENASDVTVQATLNEKARGDLALAGALVPSYSLTLAPGAYRWGAPNMGDTVPLVVISGRLNVNTTARVLGIGYAIGDDGDENVELTVGRPRTTLAQLLSAANRDVNALARR